MKNLLLGFVLALVLAPAAIVLCLKLGLAPVSTAAPPLPFEKTLAHIALQARVEKEAPREPPFNPSDDDSLAGARHYRTHCAVCHGLPDQPESPIAKGMFPKPPQLFRGKGVSDDPAGETYWKVANGIRLSGMPGFRESLSEKEIWQVSLLLARSDKVPPAALTELRQPMRVP